jgi:hypothetical protein
MAFAPLSLLADMAILTTDLSGWYGQSTLWALALLIGVALWAFRMSLGGRPLLPVSWAGREAW